VPNTVVFAGKNANVCRVPPHLLARNSHQCGRMNVSFTGVYREH